MASSWDLLAGLTQGTNRAIEAYAGAQDKKKSREHEMGLLKATKGLVQKTDEAGNVIENEYGTDPEFERRERLREAIKSKSDAAKEGKIIDVDDQGNVSFKGYSPEYIKGQKEIYGAKSEGDPYGNKALTAELARENLESKRREKTPEGKIEKLSGEARSRFDNVTGGISALRDMKAAYMAKPRTGLADKLDLANVPLRGDTPYTEASNRFDEMLGRMQSGGAIGKEELKSFQKLRPQITDSPEIAQTKFDKMEELLSGRLKSFGLDESSAESMGFLKPKQGLIAPKEGLINQEKKAVQPSPDDIEAMNWLKQNPNDPMAAQIKMQLEKKGIVRN